MTPSPFEAWLIEAGFTPLAGVDEAGRGACAGPLVAAAVVLDFADPERAIEGLDDSKALTPKRRDALYDVILAKALAVASVEITPGECDRWGLQEANVQALRRAVWRLAVAPAFVVTDGFPVDGLPGPGLGMWKGDQVARSVQAASIVAKVTRDRQMARLDEQYPGYGFADHKGYATALHQARLEALGPSPCHRLTYANVAQAARVSPP